MAFGALGWIIGAGWYWLEPAGRYAETTDAYVEADVSAS